MFQPSTKQDAVLVARGAVALFQGEIGRILDKADPADPGVRDLLHQRIQSENDLERRLRALDLHLQGGARTLPDSAQLDEYLARSFPLSPRGTDEAPLDRDIVLYLLENLEEARAWFFEGLAKAGSSDEIERLLSEEAARSRNVVRDLRTGVLKT